MIEDKSYFRKLVHPGFILSLILACGTAFGGIIKLSIDKALLFSEIETIEIRLAGIESRTGTLPEDVKDVKNGISDIKFYIKFLAEKSHIDLPIPPEP